jgi:hypothetical protein
MERHGCCARLKKNIDTEMLAGKKSFGELRLELITSDEAVALQLTG